MKKQLESKHILNQGLMMYNDSNPRIFKCKLCPNHKAVSQLKKLNIHFKLIHPESNNKIVQCLACTENNLFKSIKSLFTHVQEFHRRLYQPFRCNFCSFGAFLAEDIDNHKQLHHPIMARLQCEFCSKNFFSIETHQNHLFQDHEHLTRKSRKYKSEMIGILMANDANPRIFGCGR